MSDQVILGIVRSACRLTKGELRYQLAKQDHPLAESGELLKTLTAMEREGLVRMELVISLGEEGRETPGDLKEPVAEPESEKPTHEPGRARPRVYRTANLSGAGRRGTSPPPGLWLQSLPGRDAL